MFVIELSLEEENTQINLILQATPFPLLDPVKNISPSSQLYLIADKVSPW